MIYNLQLSEDELATVWEALSDYAIDMQRNVKVYQGYAHKQSYYIQEMEDANRMLEKLKEIQK